MASIQALCDIAISRGAFPGSSYSVRSMEGRMEGSEMECPDDVELVAARGLGSFLHAVAVGGSGVGADEAADGWIRALESTRWTAGMTAEGFVRRVTINALAALHPVESLAL